MPTIKQVLSNSWVLIVEDTVEFLVENSSSYPAQLTFQTTTPAVDAAYHTLGPGEGITRMGLVGNLYARDFADDIDVATIIVTK
jgi:hypothetical protein